MAEKIHCDLLEIFGPDWSSLSKEKVDCIVSSIHSLDQMLGEEPELFGFVGTQKDEKIVGGYFAIQYKQENYYYDRKKRLEIQNNRPFARLFFVFFADTGKLLLQNTKFVGIDLTMPKALRLLKDGLNVIFDKCGVYRAISLDLAPEVSSKNDFIREFERSTRVTRITAINPNVYQIPEEFTYYNPQRERNSIIRDSHNNDYSHLKRIELEAQDQGDLKRVHMRDLVYSGELQTMAYYIGEENFVMRRQARRKFEFYIDTEAEQLPVDQLKSVVTKLRQERAAFLDTPTAFDPRRSPGQLTIFDEYNHGDGYEEDEDDDEDDD